MLSVQFFLHSGKRDEEQQAASMFQLGATALLVCFADAEGQ
jgi:hypothetical protein